jgi:hypothetical protein
MRLGNSSFLEDSLDTNGIIDDGLRWVLRFTILVLLVLVVG